MRDARWEQYEDMLYLTPPTSKKHPRMSMQGRAAQFAPFAALTGLEDALDETARCTERFEVLEEDAIARLNEKIQKIQSYLPEQREIQITYFVPDERKEGGTYMKYKGCVRRIDAVYQSLVMQDKTVIPMKYLYEIEGEGL
jgi:hypothetical protein